MCLQETLNYVTQVAFKQRLHFQSNQQIVSQISISFLVFVETTECGLSSKNCYIVTGQV